MVSDPSDSGSIRCHYPDGHYVADPAGRSFFAGANKLKWAVAADRLSIDAVRQQHSPVMHVGSNLAESEDYLVSVATLNYDVNPEVLAMGFLWYPQEERVAE
jgi:hypothetical protein